MHTHGPAEQPVHIRNGGEHLFQRSASSTLWSESAWLPCSLEGVALQFNTPAVYILQSPCCLQGISPDDPLAREFSFVALKEDIPLDIGAGRVQQVTSLNSAQILSNSHGYYVFFFPVNGQKVSGEAGGAGTTTTMSGREDLHFLHT